MGFRESPDRKVVVHLGDGRCLNSLKLPLALLTVKKISRNFCESQKVSGVLRSPAGEAMIPVIGTEEGGGEFSRRVRPDPAEQWRTWGQYNVASMTVQAFLVRIHKFYLTGAMWRGTC